MIWALDYEERYPYEGHHFFRLKLPAICRYLFGHDLSIKHMIKFIFRLINAKNLSDPVCLWTAFF